MFDEFFEYGLDQIRRLPKQRKTFMCENAKINNDNFTYLSYKNVFDMLFLYSDPNAICRLLLNIIEHSLQAKRISKPS